MRPVRSRSRAASSRRLHATRTATTPASSTTYGTAARGLSWKAASMTAQPARAPTASTTERSLLAVGALAGWAVIDAAFHDNPRAAVPYVVLLAGVVAVLVACSRLDEAARDLLLTGLIACGVLVAALGWLGLVLHDARWTWQGQGLWRASSTLTYPNATAVILAMLALLAVARLTEVPHSVLLLIATTGLLTGLVATLSRGGLLALVVGLVVLGALMGPRVVLRAAGAQHDPRTHQGSENDEADDKSQQAAPAERRHQSGQQTRRRNEKQHRVWNLGEPGDGEQRQHREDDGRRVRIGQGRRGPPESLTLPGPSRIVEHQTQPAKCSHEDAASDQASQKQITRGFVETAARDEDRHHAGKQHDVRDSRPWVVMEGSVDDCPAGKSANREHDGAVAARDPRQARGDEQCGTDQ